MHKNNKEAKDKKNKDLVMSDYQCEKLKKPFEETMNSKENREKSKGDKKFEAYKLLLNKAEIDWIFCSHTGVPVPAQEFNGYRCF